jgi:cobaltochelatase CobT
MKRVLKMLHNYQNSIVAYAKIICSAFKVNLFFGNGCKTDGKTIVVPRLPEYLKKEDLQLTLALVLHECGHILFSDFKLFRLFVDRINTNKLNEFLWCNLSTEQNFRMMQYGPVVKDSWNAIEDHFMEMKVERKWNGAKAIFHDSFVYMKKKGQLRQPDELADMLGMYSYYVLSKLRGYEVDDLLGEVVDKLIETFGNDIMQTLCDAQYLLASRFPDVYDTEKGLHLAVDYIVLFDDFLEVKKNKDKEKSSESSNEDSEDDSDVDSKPSPNGSQSGSDKNSNDNDNNTPENPDSSSLLKGKPASGEVKNAAEAVTLLSNEIKDGLSGHYKPWSLLPVTDRKRDPNHDKFLVTKDFRLMASLDSYESGYRTLDKNLSQYRAMMSKLPKSANKLKIELLKLLNSPSRSEKVIGKRGKIKSNKLHRLGVKNYEIFEKQIDTVRPTSAVSLLVDLSGSMDGERIEIASQVIAVFEQVLGSVKIPLSIYGFGDDQYHLLSIIKSFGDSSACAKARIGSIVSSVGGLTPLHTGLYESSIELIQQASMNKVMFVITDGTPSDHQACQFQISKNIKSGIRTVFFVIGGMHIDWLKGSGADVILIDNISDLYKLTFNKAAAFLAA